VVAGSPAEGLLQAGEQVLAVDGEPVLEPVQVGDAVRSQPVGSTLVFEVLREGEVTSVEVVSAANPEDPSLAYVGIAVGSLYSAADFDIDFTLSDVGGPSAGLMFSLAIVDILTPQSLTGGGFVAGTGTIDPSGQVGAIGGIRQKLAGARDAGATLFLMPDVHCAEARGFIPDGLTAVPVQNLDQALGVLDAWRAGKPLLACPEE
jgi:PDZ domain-containing protein